MDCDEAKSWMEGCYGLMDHISQGLVIYGKKRRNGLDIFGQERDDRASVLDQNQAKRQPDR